MSTVAVNHIQACDLLCLSKLVFQKKSWLCQPAKAGPRSSKIYASDPVLIFISKTNFSTVALGDSTDLCKCCLTRGLLPWLPQPPKLQAWSQTPLTATWEQLLQTHRLSLLYHIHMVWERETKAGMIICPRNTTPATNIYYFSSQNLLRKCMKCDMNVIDQVDLEVQQLPDQSVFIYWLLSDPLTIITVFTSFQATRVTWGAFTAPKMHLLHLGDRWHCHWVSVSQSANLSNVIQIWDYQQKHLLRWLEI